MSSVTPGDLIREARARAGLSLRQLGLAAGGYSPQYMNDLELDRRRLAPQRWHLLLYALPSLDKRALAEAYLASGPVELDAALLTPPQRATLLEALVAQAEPAQRKPPATRGAR